MAAVRASGLVKRFETTCALDGVALEVEEGEVRGLLGPNGAGKTTLLRLLLGLVAPDSGSIEVLGRSLAPGSPPGDSVAGFVEDPSFYPYLSARANLELLAELDGGAAHRRVQGALERVGLAGRASDRVAGYSSGMRQRLGIAATLLRAPRLLLLDEPTAGLDPPGVREVIALVQELAGEGAAVILSSHQIGELEATCDSFTFLRRGDAVWSGTAAQLREQAPTSGYALHTSDDRRALEIAKSDAGVSSARPRDGGLIVAVREERLDHFVLALGNAGVAVRRLELLVSPLESMFFSLTDEAPVSPFDPSELAERALARA